MSRPGLTHQSGSGAPESPPATDPLLETPAEVAVPLRPGRRRLRTRSSRERGRIQRIGAQEVVVFSLLDALKDAVVDAPLLQDPEALVVKPGKRAYQNPWVQHDNARLDQRLVWTRGKTFRWALRSALALPALARSSGR